MFNILIIILSIVSIVSFYIEKKHILIYTIILFNSNFFNFFNESIYIFDSILLRDLSIILFLFLIINSKFINYPYSKYIYLFFVGLFCLIVFDIYFRDNDALSIFKSTRHLIFLLALNLDGFTKSVIKKTFNLVILSGVLISVLYLFAILLNVNFFPFEFEYNGVGLITKKLNYSPIFLTLYIILLIPSKDSLYKRIFMFIFILSLLLSSSLGSTFSILMAFLIHYFFKYRFSSQKFVIILSTSILIFLSTDLIKEFYKEKGLDNVSDYFSLNINNINKDYLNELRFSGSGSFRWGVLVERLSYVISDPERFIFGLGFTPDQDLKSQLFVLGTESPSLRVGYEQYNTKDIFLPNIITRFGIFLSIYFLFVIYKLYDFTFKNKFSNYHMYVGFLFMITLFFRSFNNNTFFDGINYFILFLFLTNKNIFTNSLNLRFEKK